MGKRFDYRRELKSLSGENRVYRIAKLKEDILNRLFVGLDTSNQVRDLSYLEQLNKQNKS